MRRKQPCGAPERRIKAVARLRTTPRAQTPIPELTRIGLCAVIGSCAVHGRPRSSRVCQGLRSLGPASSCSKCRRPQLSAPFHGVGEKCVSGLRAKKAVSGVDINRATNDDWAGPVNRTAVRWDAIDRAILDFRVHIPDDTTVFGRVGAKGTR